MVDTFKTISQSCTGEFRDRGSKFLAYAFPCNEEAGFHAQLDLIRKEHPKARHHCYAYRFGLDKNNYRANDDGEPSGTAGRPILGQIDSFGFTDVGVVVVRYFGGTLLGTSGLIHAYKTSAQAALGNAVPIEKTVEQNLRLVFSYAIMPDVMNAVKKLEVSILSQNFEEMGELVIGIKKSQVEETLVRFKALVCKVSNDEARLLMDIGGLKVAFL